ncbi:MAG: 3-phosphoshikimate 1-carboxyvinyltransferase [Methanonatronarchaeales archaeon]|nr:3-phosphoshikimate 1-carboxyvinyltransferase [Methanonatronarchaeales archaeon]
MDVKVYPSEVSGEVEAPPSKSYSHRAVLTAAASGGSSRIENLLLSDDVVASVEATRALGAAVSIEPDGGSAEVEGFGCEPETPENVLDLGNSGTTLRLCVGLCGLVEGAAVLTGDGSLRSRPNGPLLEAMNELGAGTFSTRGDGTAPVVVRGGFRGGTAEMDGSVSSQFFSSILLAAQCGEEPTVLGVDGGLRSRPYVEMTMEVLREAGGTVEAREEGFVARPSHLTAFEFTVPGDYSSASYPLALGALSGGVEVRGLGESGQGDAAILEILGEMGASVEARGSSVAVSPRGLSGVKVDCGDTPDLVPTLAVLGALAEGTTAITGVSHLRYKETDRLAAMATELKKMGAEVEEGEEFLRIEGGDLDGAELEGHGDHRVVMALTVAALSAGSPSVIRGAECVDVSFPGFFEVLEGMGARIEMAG